jgi:hypothetical protein
MRVVEELSQLSNISLCITSRISTIPPIAKTLEIPALSMEAARNAFYRIYKTTNGQIRSTTSWNNSTSIRFNHLAATVAHQNKWDPTTDQRMGGTPERTYCRRNTRRASPPRSNSHSPLRCSKDSALTPRAPRVIAFFPQGVDENNLDGCSPPSPTRQPSSTSSAFFP